VRLRLYPLETETSNGSVESAVNSALINCLFVALRIFAKQQEEERIRKTIIFRQQQKKRVNENKDCCEYIKSF
jgi:hypothetical protein